jgi:ParB family chromosome partitioning protein
MIYSNIQRTNVLPSEKANAYKLQMETMRHQGKKGLSTPDAVGKKYGDNARKVQRYIRLTYLIQDLLELVDKKKLSMQAGYWISFLDEPEQNWILKTYQLYGKLPSCRTAQQLRDQHDEGVLTKNSTEGLILGNRYCRRVTLKTRRLNQIFSPEYDTAQIEEIIYQLLDRWKEEQE